MNSLSYLIVEYGIVNKRHGAIGHDESRLLLSNGGTSNSNSLPEVPRDVPLYSWTDQDFTAYVAIIMWITMVMTGLGTEVLVWLMFIRGWWNKERENHWWLAQFYFPLLGATSIGLSLARNYLAMPLIVITVWKFGFPETILRLRTALYCKNSSKLARLANLLSGVGSVIHHSASALYVAALVTGLLPPNRYILQVTIPLVVQHWFVLLKYHYNVAYVLIETVLEIWFEWTAIPLLPYIHMIHWTGGMIGGGMLFAHWLYFIGGFVSLLAERLEHKDNQHDQEAGASSVISNILAFHSTENALERFNSFRTAIEWVGDDTKKHVHGSKVSVDDDDLEEDISMPYKHLMKEKVVRKVSI